MNCDGGERRRACSTGLPLVRYSFDLMHVGLPRISVLRAARQLLRGANNEWLKWPAAVKAALDGGRAGSRR